MAKIKSTLDIQLDLTRSVQELTEVISAVIASQPARRKEILIGLDIAVGNALAERQAKRKRIKKQMMIAQEKFPERRDGGRRLDKWEVFKFSTALGSSAVTYFYGGWSGVLGVLLALVIIVM
nr:hypothetical protein [Paenibacillus polymyxa]